MTNAVGLLNRVLTAAFDGVFLPFRGLHPFWGLLAVSVLTGVLMLWLFGKTTNQSAIHRVRDRIRGQLIGIRLFGDDLGLLFRLQGRILRDTGIYLRYALPSLLVLLPPVVLILIQLDLRYTARPLAPGESALVTVRLHEASALERGDVALEASEGVVIETPPVRALALREVTWRVRAGAPGRHRLRVSTGGQRVDKELLVAEDAWGRTPERRTGEGLWDLLLSPGEPPLPAGAGVASIEVAYPTLRLSILGWSPELLWLYVFFVVSLAAGFALRKPLGVEI